MAIEVFADVGCPFAHIGLLRFVDGRAARERSDVRLRVHAWPLEVVNAEPLDPGFIAEEIGEITAQMGGDYFDGFEAGSFPVTSIPAMALADAGYEVDDLTGEAISLELRELVFRRGTDVSDPDVLRGVAQRHSVRFDPADDESHRATVIADYERGRSLGVSGSPHFFTPDGDYFCPTLDVGRDDGGDLRVGTDPPGFGEFLADCFEAPAGSRSRR